MYFDDHNPPHFHAIYGGREAQIGIVNVDFIDGSLPGRAQGMIREWAALHRPELLENWRRFHNSEAPNRIDPLE